MHACNHACGDMEGEPALRFAVGDRVRCKVAPSTWAAGVVTQVHYREPQWPAHAGPTRSSLTRTAS